jgi:hypothetical protein
VTRCTKDWEWALGLHGGIAECDARRHSTLTVHDVSLGLLTLTATARGVSSPSAVSHRLKYLSRSNTSVPKSDGGRSFSGGLSSTKSQSPG